MRRRRRRIPRIQIQIESACTRAEAGWGLIKGALLQRRRAYTGLVLRSDDICTVYLYMTQMPPGEYPHLRFIATKNI